LSSLMGASEASALAAPTPAGDRGRAGSARQPLASAASSRVRKAESISIG
jgi:hypothetical protein